MKRLISLMLVLCMIFAAVPCLSEEAAEKNTIPDNWWSFGDFLVEVNGDSYTIVGMGAASSDTITLPEDLHGYIYNKSGQREYLFHELYDIAPEAFKNRDGVVEIKFEEGIAVIPRGLCKGMRDLKTVVLPNSVYAIDNEAFKDCEALETIDLSCVEGIGRSAFEGCKSLETVTLSESIEFIDGYAFYGCEKLKTVNGLTEDVGIGYEAFVGTLVVPYNEEPSQSDDDGMVFEGGYLYLGQSSFKNQEDIVELTVDALSRFSPDNDPESEKYDFTTSDTEIIKAVLGTINACRHKKVYGTMVSDGTAFLIKVKYADGTEADEMFKESTISVGNSKYQLISEDYWNLAECIEGIKKGMTADDEASLFKDVAYGSEYYDAVKALSKLSIMEGYEDGTFKCEGTLTRAEAAAIIVRLLKLEGEVEQGETMFSDVPKSHWASGYINTAVANGIVNGQGDDTFAPEEPLTYHQLVKMLVCALGYEAMALANGGWNNGGYVTAAEKIGLIESEPENKDEPITRGEAAQMVYKSLNIELMDQASDGGTIYGEFYQLVGKTILTEYWGIEE